MHSAVSVLEDPGVYISASLPKLKCLFLFSDNVRDLVSNVQHIAGVFRVA